MKFRLIESKDEQSSLDVKFVKAIIDKIHQEYLDKQKPPTGNQNCMLCTWCLEAQLRNIDILPRAVYSPNDIIFSSIKGYDIIKGGRKQHFKNFTELKNLMADTEPDSRFYTHVKWKNGDGGHEFILMNVKNKIYIVDAQQGKMINIDSEEAANFFDIDFMDSYIVRLDDKELNNHVLKYNDKKYLKQLTKNEQEELDKDYEG